jgi:hypothetical protein
MPRTMEECEIAAVEFVARMARFTDPRKSSDLDDELVVFARMIEEAKKLARSYERARRRENGED